MTDNTFNTARTVDYNAGTIPIRLSGVVGGEDDQSDFVTFIVAEAGTITVSLNGFTSDVDLHRSLDADTPRFGSSTFSGTRGETLTFSVSAGQEITLEVLAFENAESPYQLTVNFEPINDNSFQNALSLDGITNTGFAPENTPYAEGNLGPDDTDDYYRFTATQTGELSLFLTGQTTDVDLYIFDEDQNQIGQSIDPGDSTELVTVSVIEGETYFIHVDLFSTNDETSYTLFSTFDEPQSTSEAQANRNGIVEFDLDFSDETRAFNEGRRWEPGQTIGYNFADASINDTQRELVRELFDGLSNILNLNFVEDPFGAFQFVLDESLLQDGILGRAFLAREPFNVITLTSLADAEVLFHEIFHGLGAGHALESNFADSNIHGHPFTLLGLRQATLADGQDPAYGSLEPTGLLSLDLQYLIEVYGPDASNLADTIHRYNTANNHYEGLHDSGGNDTVIVEDAAAIGVRVDITPGAAFDLGTIVGDTRNITVFQTAPTLIENVVTDLGNDTITGNNVANALDGGGGDDTISAANGADTVEGGTGHDTLSGGGGNDILMGGSGDDILIGGAGQDTLFGGNDRDRISGQNGDDHILGGSSVDTLIGGVGADYLDGGNSLADRASYITSPDGIRVTLEENGAVTYPSGGDATGDTLLGIEHIIGSNFDDSITGNSLNNRLQGQSGNDTLSGGNGNDILNAGVGNDFVQGGAGDDIIRGQGGDDTLLGGAGDDFIIGGGGRDLVQYDGLGNDSLRGFSRTQDTLDLSMIDGLDTREQLLGLAEQVEAGLLLDFGDGNSLLIERLKLNQLDNISVIL